MSDEIEKLREELAEANARRDDMRTALEWANEERDRLREQLAAKHSECPDCADYAARSGRFAEQADRLQRERDEARAELHASNEQMDFIAKALQLEHDDDIEDAVTDMVAEMEHARDRIEELRAEVERLLERVTDHAAKFESGLNVLRRERDEACEMVTRIEQEAYRIKLEARAEVATAAKYCDELAETIRMHVAREIELEAEVAELRAKYDSVLEANVSLLDGAPYADQRTAYRRGAEAMREACAQHFVGDIERASSAAHDAYQREAHRRGDVRHADAYEDLSEATKEWDRVLCRWAADEIRALPIPEDKP